MPTLTSQRTKPRSGLSLALVTGLIALIYALSQGWLSAPTSPRTEDNEPIVAHYEVTLKNSRLLELPYAQGAIKYSTGGPFTHPYPITRLDASQNIPDTFLWWRDPTVQPGSTLVLETTVTNAGGKLICRINLKRGEKQITPIPKIKSSATARVRYCRVTVVVPPA